MFKKSLTDTQMSDAAFVDDAVFWSKDLTRMRARGPGDVENAMRGIERDYGIPYWTLWQLRYTRDRIKSIGAGAYARLKYAYQAERERQRRLLGDDTNTTEQVTGPRHPAVVASKAALGTPDAPSPDRPPLLVAAPQVPPEAPPETVVDPYADLDIPPFLRRQAPTGN